MRPAVVVSRCVMVLDEPTVDHRVVTDLDMRAADDHAIPVMMDGRHIGEVQMLTVHAALLHVQRPVVAVLALFEDEPDGRTPVLDIWCVEEHLQKDEFIQIKGQPSAVTYTDRPAWPDLAEWHDEVMGR